MSTSRQIKSRRRRKRRRNRNTLIIVIITCALVLITGLCIFFIKQNNKKNSNNKEAGSDGAASSAKELSLETKSKEPVSVTLSFMGDCTLGTDKNFDQSKSLNAYYDKYGADYFFENVRSILEEDDLSVVNFEGTLTTQTTRMDKRFAFKGDPSYVSILSGSSVEAANIANNHSRDYGEQSRQDTIETLTGAGIAVFGEDETVLLDVKGVKIGLLGIYELPDHLGREPQLKANIQKLRDEGAQIVIANFHWGIEKDAMPNSNQTTLAHMAIDSGADLVIGHHPHVLQGIEKYNGKYICYSLGNFCFGGNSNPSDKDTMIFQQTFTIGADGTLQVDDNINVIACNVSSVSDKNDYKPTPATGDEKTRIEEKIQKRSEGL